jgi:prepilin-type N-terminal cleavage/methylation domain-containing protein
MINLTQPLPAKSPAFTLVELMAVVAIIAILAGLTLGGAGAVRRHGATSRAKGEIAALEAACARYYTDFSGYPTATANDPNRAYSLSAYTSSGQILFTNLFGTNIYSARPTSGKRYFEPKPSMVSSTNNPNPYFIDPWGYPYGYYSDGTNSPLIWSTGGTTNQMGTNKWITSWPRG